MDDDDEPYAPWYDDLANEHPYTLRRTIKLSTGPTLRGLAPFPWEQGSLTRLWNGSLYTAENEQLWKGYYAAYWDAVAVAGDDGPHIVFVQSAKAPITLPITQVDQPRIDADRPYVAWTMQETVPFEPLLLFAYGSILHIFNVAKRTYVGYQRAHGGAITSIAVHPVTPGNFATTSRDHTTRIYDLSLPAVIPPPPQTGRRKKVYNPNPHWPPSKVPSLAGAPHGLRLHPDELEGIGPGRCVAVLMGGRSGGHNAAVLHASFNPGFRLIATCGMDRTVKIWPLRPDHPERIKREDKPFFSSSKLHKARVLSVNWLSDEILVTASASAINRKRPLDPKNKAMYLEAGEITKWTWLSLHRFFPPQYENVGLNTAQPISSDYQESSSFKIISTHSFPRQPNHIIAPAFNMFQNPTHDPLITFVYPDARHFTILNPTHMKIRPVPAFPYPALNRYPPPEPPQPDPPEEEAVDSGDEEARFLAFETERLDLAGQRGVSTDDAVMRSSADDDDDEEDHDNAQGPSAQRRLDKGKGRAVDPPAAEGDPDSEPEYGVVPVEKPPEDNDDEEEQVEPQDEEMPLRRRVEFKPPPIEGWRVDLPDPKRVQRAAGREQLEGAIERPPGLMNAAIAGGGRLMVGVGTQGMIWVWRYDT